MTANQLKELVQDIVAEAHQLSVAHTDLSDAPVNYACVFCQSSEEYTSILSVARELGSIVHDTAMGPVFHIAPLATIAGSLHLLKIRRPDPKRPERGDADFTVSNYESFKKEHLSNSGWRIIQRPDMEMLELSDPSFHVLAYYSYPTLEVALGITSNGRTSRKPNPHRLKPEVSR